jgi:outer membrane protein assembly factor BamB
MQLLPKAIFAALLLVAWSALGQEWSRFRGPNGSGVSHCQGIPTQIGESNCNWKVQLPGTGHSSPVLWGERVFVTTTGDKGGGIRSCACVLLMAFFFGARIFR